MKRVSLEEYTDQYLVDYFLLCYFIIISNCRNDHRWMQEVDNVDSYQDTRKNNVNPDTIIKDDLPLYTMYQQDGSPRIK